MVAGINKDNRMFIKPKRVNKVNYKYNNGVKQNINNKLKWFGKNKWSKNVANKNKIDKRNSSVNSLRRTRKARKRTVKKRRLRMVKRNFKLMNLYIASLKLCRCKTLVVKRLSRRLINKRKRLAILSHRHTIKRWRNKVRMKKRDKQVQIVWRKGKKMKRITKLGRRASYRPVKHKFPGWWKLGRSTKRNKKRKSNKNIFSLFSLNRQRNPKEFTTIRKWKIYSRNKRIADHMTWKLMFNNSMFKCFVSGLTNGTNDLENIGGVTTLLQAPNLNVSKHRIIYDLSTGTPYRNNKKQKLVSIMNKRCMNNSSHNQITNTHWSKNVVNVLAYQNKKRYCKRKNNMTTNRSHVDSVYIERVINNWRHEIWINKERDLSIRSKRFVNARKLRNI